MECAVHVIPELDIEGTQMRLPLPHYCDMQGFLAINAFSLTAHHHLHDGPAIPQFSHVQRSLQVALDLKKVFRKCLPSDHPFKFRERSSGLTGNMDRVLLGAHVGDQREKLRAKCLLFLHRHMCDLYYC